MLSGNIFAVVVYNSAMGAVAEAVKFSRSYNLASIIKRGEYITFNVCKTFKDAEKIAESWNKDFIANGSQVKL